jgi:hypothetical protein
MKYNTASGTMVFKLMEAERVRLEEKFADLEVTTVFQKEVIFDQVRRIVGQKRKITSLENAGSVQGDIIRVQERKLANVRHRLSNSLTNNLIQMAEFRIKLISSLNKQKLFLKWLQDNLVNATEYIENNSV